jgi:hypothetical protein
MAHPALFLALALVSFLSTPLVSAQEYHDNSLRRKETMDSLLQSLLEGRAQSPQEAPSLSKHRFGMAASALERGSERRAELSAPLAHPSPPRAQILPSLHLMRVTGAQASLASAQESDSARSREALGKKYEYVRELRRQFEQAKNE